MIFSVYFFFSFIDVILRPISDSDEITDRYTIILLFFFLAGPLIILAAIYENQLIISQLLTVYNTDFFFILGIIIMIIGGLILSVSRYQLNKFTYGGGSLSEEKAQNLITKGMYRYVRHPIYFGGLIMTFGLELALRSIMVLSVHIIIFLVIFNDRMKKEETVLLEKFGEEYRKYKNTTKKLIPRIF
jgi:protein-S-isoprenylcysteine O-methyltransferase Ste14